MTNLLQVENLTRKYGNNNAVDAVSFELEEHTATALIGPNGAGKTTTLSMLAGLVSPTSGTIEFKGNINQDIRSVIGFLPQYPKFFPWLSALEFTEMAARLSGVETRQAIMEAQKTLEFVGLGEALNKKTGTFSGGMKQRLGLAQAIVHKPKLLLLDEPVSALDPVGRRQVMNFLKELQQETTILYSTHILNDAEEMTDQLLFLRQGKLVEHGSLNEVRARYAEPKIVIEFEGVEELQRFTETVEWQVTSKGLIASIDVRSEGAEMSSVLPILSAGTFLVRKVELQTASLEEIFMKVVVI
jgi:ABC-2 type transport system ATP-binding protein